MGNGDEKPYAQLSNGWRFEKRISFDTIIAVGFLVAGIGGPAFLAWNAMDKRVTISETVIKQVVEQLVARDAEARDERVAAVARGDRMAAAMQAMQLDIARLITIQTQTQRK